MDFTNRLHLLEPNRRMLGSWMLSSGIRLSFVVAMKSHLGLLAIIRSISVQSRIKGIVSTEEEALQRIRQSNPGLLFCTDQLAAGNGFSLCRRALQCVPDLRIIMVLTADTPDVGLALERGAMAVVCEDDVMAPEMEVMQALLAAANGRPYVSSRARLWLKQPEALVDSPQSLTERERDVLSLMLQGRSDRDIAVHLGISANTVKEYGKSIRRKYRVKNRLQLISLLLARNLQPARAR